MVSKWNWDPTENCFLTTYHPSIHPSWCALVHRVRSVVLVPPLLWWIFFLCIRGERYLPSLSRGRVLPGLPEPCYRDITGDSTNGISLARNWWLLGRLGWMLLSLSAQPPAPIRPTPYAADTGCNLRPLRQRGGDAMPADFSEGMVVNIHPLCKGRYFPSGVTSWCEVGDTKKKTETTSPRVPLIPQVR